VTKCQIDPLQTAFDSIFLALRRTPPTADEFGHDRPRRTSTARPPCPRVASRTTGKASGGHGPKEVVETTHRTAQAALGAGPGGRPCPSCRTKIVLLGPARSGSKKVLDLSTQDPGRPRQRDNTRSTDITQAHARRRRRMGRGPSSRPTKPIEQIASSETPHTFSRLGGSRRRYTFRSRACRGPST